MHILFLDLASNSGTLNEGACIACVSDNKTESITFTDHRLPDNQLIPALNEVLAQAGWNNKDITHIACVTGPGGFTSLRVAVTLANTYGDQLGIPMVGVNLSDLYAARTPVSPCGGKGLGDRGRLWLHSTKKTQLFIRSFDSDQWPEPTLIKLEDLVTQLPENAQIIGEILPEHREVIAGKHPSYPAIRPIVDILPDFLVHLPYTAEALTAWYGRGW